MPVTIHETASGWVLSQNGEPLKTPLSRPMVLPNAAIAQAVAQEWGDKTVKLQKETMPLTAIACLAIDLASEKHEAVIADIVPYLDTDMLCYRAGNNEVLRKRQEELLDPIVSYAKNTLRVMLAVTDGIMPVKQPIENEAHMRVLLGELDCWHLAVAASLTKALSSLILAFAVLRRHVDAETAFHLAYLEEEYETQQWGQDAEKEMKIRKAKADVCAAGVFLQIL